jgi:hypothetical protein
MSKTEPAYKFNEKLKWKRNQITPERIGIERGARIVSW